MHISKGINSNFAILKLKEVKSKNIIIFYTAGKENPLLEPTNDKKMIKKDDEIRLLSRDQLICEEILADFIMQKSSVLIAVIEQLSYVEQIMLTGLIERLKAMKKKITKNF